MSETDNSDEKQIIEVAQLYGFHAELKCDSTKKKKDSSLKLSSDNPECCITFTLLDDMQGEDVLLFVLQALQAIKKQLGTSWEFQFEIGRAHV